MSAYSEINLDETPIILLRCGHFFAADTLDGLLDIGSVYKTDANGDFVGLQDFSDELAERLPACPDCRQPLQQYSAQRYNRIINRAIIDEMTKRFTTSTEIERQRLQDDVETLARDLAASRETLLPTKISGFLFDVLPDATANMLRFRERKSHNLKAKTDSFLAKFADEKQPARKLYDATRKAAELTSNNTQATTPRDHAIGVPSLDSLAPIHGKSLQLRFHFTQLTDQLLCLQQTYKTSSNPTPP